MNGLRQLNRHSLARVITALEAERLDVSVMLGAQRSIDAARQTTPDLPEIALAESAMQAARAHQQARQALLEARRINPKLTDSQTFLYGMRRSYLASIRQAMKFGDYTRAEQFIGDALLAVPGDAALLELLTENESLM